MAAAVLSDTPSLPQSSAGSAHSRAATPFECARAARRDFPTQRCLQPLYFRFAAFDHLVPPNQVLKRTIARGPTAISASSPSGKPTISNGYGSGMRHRRKASARSADPPPRPRQSASTASRPINSNGICAGIRGGASPRFARRSSGMSRHAHPPRRQPLISEVEAAMDFTVVFIPSVASPVCAPFSQ